MADKPSDKAATGEKVGDKMTNKQREILRIQRSLLSRNIVWSSNLAARMKERRLLTDSMIAQIDATHGRDKQILMLLDLLPLRTTQVYDKFVDALHLSGHALLADFLRDEDLSLQPLNVEDLFERLPFLFRNLKDKEKAAVESYMLEKVSLWESGSRAVCCHTWRWNTKDKDKALASKIEQVEQAYRHEQAIINKDNQVQESERVAKEAREETLALKAELRAVTDNAGRLQQQMKGQLDTQVRFNMANDNIARRLSERLKIAEHTLKKIQDTLHSTLKFCPHDKERDLKKLTENAFHFLPEDVELFSAQFQNLRLLQTKYEKLSEECAGVLTLLGLPTRPDKVSVLQAYQDFAHQKEEEIHKLQQEVTRQEQLVDDVSKARKEEERKLTMAGTVWQNAIMSVMRKQLQDIKAAVRKKDTTINMKEEELTKLRAKVTDLEQSLGAKTKEASQTMRALKLMQLQASSDTLPADITHPTDDLRTSTTKAQTLPSVYSSGLQTSSSPRAGVQRPHHPQNIALPGGVVVEANTQLEMYPAGLSTVPLSVARNDGARTTQSDPKSRNQVRSTLGDLRSMHVHSRYPASRGTGGDIGLENPTNHSVPPMSRGGGGTGLDHSGYPNKTRMTSPGAKRKFAQRVK